MNGDAMKTMYLLAPVLLSGCKVLAIEETYEIDDIETIVLRVDNGDVEIVADERDDVRVDLDYGGVTMDEVGMDQVGDVLYIDLDCGLLPTCGGDLRLMVPPSLEIDATLEAGDLSLYELEGPVMADLWAGSLDGIELAMEYISASNTHGEVALDFELQPEQVCVDVTTGSIELDVPAGAYALDLDAAAGSVSVSGVEEDSGASASIWARTAAGSIELKGW